MQAPKFLARYQKVRRNELPAFFKITKRIPVVFSSEMSLEELWSLHAEGIKDYRKLKSRLETEALKAGAFPDASDHLRLLTDTFLEIPEATFSLLDLKIEILDRILEDCYCCERRCHINRKVLLYIQ